MQGPHSGDRQGDYRYNTHRGSETLIAELYILKFENLDDRIIILPRSVYADFITKNDSSVQGSGVLTLASHALPSLDPFTVHEKDLFTAVKSLLDSAETGSDYHNPTTGVTLFGYRPSLDARPSLSPRAERAARSCEVIIQLEKQISTLKEADFCLNPLAPLFGDFLLLISGFHLLVEHKSGNIFSRADGNVKMRFEKGKRSPFHRLRQWHWLIWQPSEDQLNGRAPCWYCIGRHQVESEWEKEEVTHVNLDISEAKRLRQTDLAEMIHHMQLEASRAIQEANRARFESDVSNADLDILLTSSALEHRAELIGTERQKDEDTEAEKEDNTEPFAEQKGTGLPWLYDRFNEQCMNGGSLVLLPLDPKHPDGNYVIAEVQWTSKQQQNFKEDRTLPISAVDAFVDDGSERRERSCVVMRFLDLSRPREYNREHLLCIRSAGRWFQPTGQPYLLLGCTGDPRILAGSLEQSDFLLLPSELIKTPEKVEVRTAHEGDRYFRPVTRSIETVLYPFIREMVDKTMDLSSFLINFDHGSVYQHLLELMNRSEGGEIRPEMEIKNPQCITPKRIFLKKTYRTTLPRVHQASWDFGCT